MTFPGARKRVAVIFGGRSTEHAISCVSAGSILRSIDRERFDVVPIGIATDGRWVLQADDPDAMVITDGKLPTVSDGVSVALAPGEVPGLVVSEPGRVPEVLGSVDVVFPVLHGPWGEDGTIQGLLELAGVPYVGSGVFASAAAMDKGWMKRLFEAAGIAVSPYVVVPDADWRSDRERVLTEIGELGLPLFVKPARAGSSLGITRVDSFDDLVPAIELAREHDPRIVIEAGVTGAREIECGVLVNATGHATASVCAEIKIGGAHQFYSFAAKYLEGGVELIVPAELPPATADAVRALAIRAFEALGCEGLARVDVFVRADGEILLNEVNTMPGFTSISMYPRMWAASGIAYQDLITALIDDALRRGAGLR